MKRIVACTSLVALALAGCGSDDGDDSVGGTISTEDGMSIEGAWARASAEGQTTGAVYFRITAPEDDRLVAVSVPASVAARAEIHEVVAADMSGEDMSGEDTSGEDMSGEGHGMSGEDTSDGDMGEMPMTMREMADGLPLPAGETVTLEPGGYHIMLLDIAEPLEVGDEIEVSLDFEQADDTTLTVEVADSAP